MMYPSSKKSILLKVTFFFLSRIEGCDSENKITCLGLVSFEKLFEVY